MDERVARERLTAERAEVLQLLKGTESAAESDREVEVDETGNYADSAQPLTAQGIDDSIAEGLRDRLAAIDRALKRLDDGSYGRSVLSGDPIPDARLDADPAAELTVEEARARHTRVLSRPPTAAREIVVPASALLTGQPAFASFAILAKSSALTPRADPLTVSLMPLIRNPPAGSGPSVTSAVTSSDWSLPPAAPSSAENCMAKHPACAAAISSSGLVVPPASSAARLGKLIS